MSLINKLTDQVQAMSQAKQGSHYQIQKCSCSKDSPKNLQKHGMICRFGDRKYETEIRIIETEQAYLYYVYDIVISMTFCTDISDYHRPDSNNKM